MSIIISDNRMENSVRYHELKAGDTFRTSDDEYYIIGKTNEGLTFALNLETGEAENFYGDTWVIPEDYELRVL